MRAAGSLRQHDIAEQGLRLVSYSTHHSKVTLPNIHRISEKKKKNVVINNVLTSHRAASLIKSDQLSFFDHDSFCGLKRRSSLLQLQPFVMMAWPSLMLSLHTKLRMSVEVYKGVHKVKT